MNNSDSNTAEKKPDFGSLLATARKNQDYSVDQIYTHIKIPVHVINAIEASDIEALPAPTYAQGYIRAYAKFLEISEDDVLASYNKAVPHTRASDLKPRSNLPGEAGSQSALVKTVALMLVLGGIVAVIFGSFQHFREKSDVMETQGEAKEPGLTGDALDSPATTDITIKQNARITQDGELEIGTSDPYERAASSADTGEAAVESAVADDAATQADMASTSPTEVIPEPLNESETVVQKEGTVGQKVAAPDKALNQDSIIIIAAEGSWVQVHDASNARLLYNMIPVGGSRTLTGQAPFRISLGNARTTRVVINDLEVDISAYIRSKNTARFTVSSENKEVIFH